jgi:hypothetical protein
MKFHVFVLGALLAFALPALGAPNCTPQTTKGYWEAACDGYLTPPPPAPQQLVPARLASCGAPSTSAI